MKKITYLILTCFLLFSCNPEYQKQIKNVALSDYTVPVSDYLYDIVLDPENYTFEALDDYYLFVKENRSNELRFDNLRRSIIYHIYALNEMKNIPKTKVEYYTNEILSIDYISDMQMLGYLLINLSGYWSDLKIQQTSIDALERNRKYIAENFENPQKIYDLPHQGAGARLLSGLATFKSTSD